MILMFDDEEYFVREYVERLREGGYEIELCTSTGVFLKRYRELGDAVELCIVDIMAFGPENKVDGRETNGGMTTGAAVMAEMEAIDRDRSGARKPPPRLVLTNRKGEAVAQLRKDSRIAEVVEKPEILPSELVVRVRRVMGTRPT